MTPDFEGRLALVTGGTRGIGRAIAERLRDLGAAVIVTGTHPDGEAPSGCAFVPADFTDPAGLAEFCRMVAEDIRPPVLVNNAGIAAAAPFAEIDPADFDRVHTVNTRASFLVTRAALPAMREAGWGRIVTLGAARGRIGRDDDAALAASKQALDGMTAALAVEAGPHGILANCVAPGLIDTDSSRAALGLAGLAELAARVPCRRPGTAEEVARLVCWLAGPENTYLTGQTLTIDGGLARA